MNESDARARLINMIQAGEEPVLEESQIADLLKMAKVPDSAGLLPSDPVWVPTWDLNVAAAEGWRWKAGKVAGKFGVTLDGEILQRHQVYAHCLKMAQSYASKAMATVVTRSTHAV